MKFFSQFRNIFYPILYLICILSFVQFSGCYSFTGGSIPEHLKTLNIMQIEDNSGFGNPLYRDLLAQKVFENFRNDNSFSLVESGGDARLQVRISSIKDEPQVVQSNELVSGNKVTVMLEAEYYDEVKQKSIWKKSFSSFNTYSIENAQAGRDQAIQAAIANVADDLLLAVISGW